MLTTPVVVVASLVASATRQREIAALVRAVGADPGASEADLRAEIVRAARALEAHEYLVEVCAGLLDQPGSSR